MLSRGASRGLGLGETWVGVEAQKPRPPRGGGVVSCLQGLTCWVGPVLLLCVLYGSWPGAGAGTPQNSCIQAGVGRCSHPQALQCLPLSAAGVPGLCLPAGVGVRARVMECFRGAWWSTGIAVSSV